MLPFYLLQDDSGWKHPRYIELSNLSQNLSENTSISITIYVSNEIQDGIDKVQQYILRDNNNMTYGMKKAPILQRNKTMKKVA